MGETTQKTETLTAREAAQALGTNGRFAFAAHRTTHSGHRLNRKGLRE